MAANAAAESEDPVRGVASAVRTAMWRTALFCVGSMAVIVTLVPWDSQQLVERGPYVATLDRLGIPGAGQVMNAVVLAALLSAMNANVYGASRIAHSLAERGQGPRALARVSGGVPRLAQGWGACDPNNPKNRRRRCSILLERDSGGAKTKVLVDMSPDLRAQLLELEVERLDGILECFQRAAHPAQRML